MRISGERLVASVIVIGATTLLIGLAVTSLRAHEDASAEPGVVMSPRPTPSVTEPAAVPSAEAPVDTSGQTTTDTYVPPAPAEVERDDDWGEDDTGDDAGDDVGED